MMIEAPAAYTEAELESYEHLGNGKVLVVREESLSH
jgi:hypothetical protein